MDTQSKERQISTILETAYGLLKEQQFEKGEAKLEEAIRIDFEHPETIACMKVFRFWKDWFVRLSEVEHPFERGELLMKAWRQFQAFLQKTGIDHEPCLFAVRQLVFSTALEEYGLFARNSEAGDPEILFRIGRCLKGRGDYMKAVEYLERASTARKDDPSLYAELADCYAFIGEARAAKAFFREAFFIDPQKVDLPLLESLLIRHLIDDLAEKGYAGSALNEWIPVYGVLYGVLNVRRELRPLEYGKLRQSIHALEAKMQNELPAEETVPRLINRYFWLIDHYICTKDGRDKIEEILEKIKALDREIFDLYVN